jgi:ABC-type nitrate/sulfonate/bicarbonate transport system substrate-binding protein
MAKSEKDFVRKLAKAFALVNGHSHPDDYAEAVAAAHESDDPADAPDADDADDKGPASPPAGG